MARAQGGGSSSRPQRLDAKGVEALLESAAQASDPIVVVIGSDEALHRLLMRTLVARAGAGGFSVTRVGARDADAARIVRQACEPTLFGDSTWLFVSQLELAGDDVLAAVKEVLPAADEDTRIVLGHSGIARGKGVITAAEKAGARKLEARPVSAAALPTVLSAHAKRAGAVLPTEAARALIDGIGTDLTSLLSIVDQLASDAQDGLIDRELVHSTLVIVGTANQFEIADLVWNRRTAEGLTAFRQLAERNGASSAGVTMVAALSYSLRTLARYVGDRPSGSPWQVASALGVPAWKVDTIAAQARQWRPAQLAQAAVLLAAADADNKGGLGEAGALDPEQKLFAVERLIRQLGG